MTTTTTDVLARVADIIEPHMTGTFKRRLRAEGAAEDLARVGLLVGGNSPSTATVQAQAEAVLQCRFDWPTAERIAAELSEAGLLKTAER